MSSRQEIALWFSSIVLFAIFMIWLGISDRKDTRTSCAIDMSLLRSAQDSIIYLRNHREC